VKRIVLILASLLPVAAGADDSHMTWQYGGFTDVGYLYDFNKPSNHLFRSRGTTFHVNEFDLNMAAVYLKKPASESSRWGTELTAQTGKDSEVFGYEKRWQDVEEVIASGISVMTALNIQHLEGVQDVVRSATGIDIRERVPDRIVRQADSVVLVDLPVAELQERLRQGKIYPPEQANRALENFFRTELLTRLRELALLQTATFSGGAAPVVVQGSAEVRLAVAVPFEPEIARPLVLRASRLAGRMNTRWYAVYVRQRRAHPENISAEQHRKLSENVQLAISLGATVVTRESEDVVGALLDFVRSEGITILVVGRPTRHGVVSRFAPSTVHKLLDQGRGFDIVIIDI